MRTPPSRRNPSMPARSVTTWKLSARRPRAMAYITALATSQPPRKITTASTSRGRKSPTCARNTRTGSSITSKRSISVPSVAFQECGQALHGNVDPRGPVVELVAKLVEHFLHLGELHQPARVVERFVDAAA